MGKKWLNIPVALAILAVILLFAYRMNCGGRLDCRALTQETAEAGGPYILTGGESSEDSVVYRLPLCGELYVCFPRASRYEVSGVECREMETSGTPLLHIYSVEPAEAEIRVYARNGTLTATEAYVYVGSYGQLNDFISSSVSTNYFIRGLCFAVVLVSVILVAWKQSEKYLIWLALTAYCVGYYSRMRDVFTFFGAVIMQDQHLYWVVNELIVSLLLCMDMRYFMPVKLGRVPIVCISSAAAVPALLLYRTGDPFLFAMVGFYAVLYCMYAVAILQRPEGEYLESNVFALGLLATIGLRAVELFCDIGILPSGDFNLRIRLRGIAAVCMVAALFLCSLKHFAECYERSDRLNSTLEKQIRKISLENATFMRSMLHNMKTPLFSVSGYTDMARKTIDTNPEAAKRYIEKAHEKALYSGRLMDNLSLSMRIGSGQLKPELVPMDLAEVVSHCMETVSPDAIRLGITVRNGCAEPMPVSGSPLYLQQAVQNILDNALVNTPAGGTVEVRAEKSPDRQKWLLHIRDNGRGIEPRDRDRIFDLYFSKRQGSSSSGLGLYITKEIIALHGGEITVESEPGKGAEFIIALPVPVPAQEEQNAYGSSME